MDRKDLKIQFRGIHYTGKSHVLQYRIDPDDERNTYIKTKKYLFGLIKRDVPMSYPCNWITVNIFNGHCDDEDEGYYLNYGPIWINSQKDVNFYKDRFKTIGQFEDYIKNTAEKNYETYKTNRAAYLKKIQPIY